MSLYPDQDQIEKDFLSGPGWTIDDQKPTFFENALAAPVRGVGQAAAGGISVLAHGLQYGGHASPMDAVMNGPAAAQEATREFQTGKQEEHPWKQSWDASAAELEGKAREYAKSLNPDPRVTGTGANIIQGFSKAVTEFTAGSVVGGPLSGAALLAASEGYGHYQDLIDQGVDPETATKAGYLEAVTAGAGALLPMGMPARWLKGLSTPATLLAQAGAGSVINTSFGAASRYASAKILEDAGYPEMAEQQKPWDETNVITDAVAGLFFGAHAGWHGLKAKNIDPALVDAAKVVQDRQEINERAPGVPVDMKSAAVHRQALESALGDLMTGKPVDLSHIDTDGATFARPEIDDSQAHAIMREEFVNAGVLDDAAAFDRWLKGEPVEESPQAAPARSIDSMSQDHVESADSLESVEPTEANLAAHIEAHPDQPVGGYLDTETGKVHLDGKETSAVRLPERDAAEANSEATRATDGQGETAAARPAGAGEAHAEAGGARGLAAAGHDGAGRALRNGGIDAALRERPGLQVPDDKGEPSSASDALQRAVEAEAQANKEAEPMFTAAVSCEARHA